MPSGQVQLFCVTNKKQAITAWFSLEATLRIELRMRVLQTRALPLGYVAINFKSKRQVILPAALLFMERETRFELAASALARQRSTTEPFPHK